MSRVQVFALELLMMHEDSERGVDHKVSLFNDVRAALVSRGADTGELYPEFARTTIDTEEAAIESLDDTSGKWEFTGAVDPAELEQVLAAMANQADLAEAVLQPQGEGDGWV